MKQTLKIIFWISIILFFTNSEVSATKISNYQLITKSTASFHTLPSFLLIKTNTISEPIDDITQIKQKIISSFFIQLFNLFLVLFTFGLIIYFWRTKNTLKKNFNIKLEALTIAYTRAQENNKALESKIRSRTEEVIDQINLHDDILTKLNQSEIKFEKIFSKNSDPMVVIDFDTLMILDINNAALNMFGLSFNNKKSTHFLNLQSTTSSYFILKVAAIIKNQQQVTNHIISQNISINNQKWFSITSQIISISNKKYYYISANNITMRKKAEISVVESEKRLKMLTENINDMIWLLDMKLQITYVSPSIINLGYHPEEIIQKSILNVISQNSFSKLKELISEHLKKQTGLSSNIIIVELEFLHKNGSVQLGEFKAKIINSSYNQLSIHGVSRDISEKVKTEMALRKSEQLYRLITNNVSDVIFTSDTSLNFKYINNAVFKFLGYTPDEILSINQEEYLQQLSINKLNSELSIFFNNIYAHKNPKSNLIFESEIEFIAKDKEPKWGFVQINLLLDEKHYIFGLIGTIHDITQNHKLEIVKQNTNDFFKKLFFESPIMMVIVKRDGVIININNAFLNKTTFEAEDIENKSIENFFDLGHLSLDEKLFQQKNKSKIGKIKTKDQKVIDILYDVELMSDSLEEESFLLVMRDISQQLLAENEALIQQQQFKALSEKSPDIIARFDKSIICTYINPIVESELLLKPSIIIGKNIREFGLNMGESEFLFNNFIQVFVDGKEKVVDFSLNINNEVKHYQSRIIPEYSGSHKVQTIMVVTRNMSEYIKAIMMLQLNIKQIAFINKAIIFCNQSKTLFELYRNILQLIIQEYGFNGGGIYSYNEEDQYARLVHEIGLQPNFSKSIRLLTPDSPFYAPIYVERNILLISSKNKSYGTWPRDFNIKTAMGMPILSKDKVVGSINLKSDQEIEINESIKSVIITISQELGSAIERIQAETMHLESEENYRSLVENTTDLVWKVNEFFVYTFASTKSINLVGYTPEEMIGMSFISLISVEEHLKIKKFLEMNKTLREKFTLVDVPLIQKSGKIIHVEINGSPLIDTQGNFIGYAGINRDISIRKINEDLRHSKEIAERMAQIKQEFVNNISHEFRTPLTSIIGHSEIISNKTSDIEINSHIQNIQSNSKSLLRLINDILDFSKIEAGKLDLQKESTNIYKFFDDIKLTFTPLAKNKNIDFTIEINQNNVSSLLIDELRLRQIVNNIVANAIKFTEVGSVKVVTTLIQSDDSPNTIDMIISVSDTGIGIASDQLNSIWNTFSQADGQSNKKYGGTGLGLSICKNLIELMQGSISIESNEYQGATFRIVIPSIEKSSEKATNEMYNILLNNKSIVIIDHDEFLYHELLVLLASNNCDISYITFNQIEQNQAKLKATSIYIFHLDHYKESVKTSHIERMMNKFKSTTIYITNDILNEQERESKYLLSYPIGTKQLHNTLIKILNDLFTKDNSLPFDLIQREIEQFENDMLPFLVQEIEQHCSPIWAKATSNNSIEQINQFERSIFKIAKTHNINFLKQYSNEILISIRRFDIEQLKILLNIYPQIVKFLKKNYTC
ncbi:MAG: PAS domain S-box protein [Bacteroidota bacterium]